LKFRRKAFVILSLEAIVVAGTVLFVLDLRQPCDFAFNACSGVVKTTTLSSAYLYAGNTLSYSNKAKLASLQLSLNNPGAETYVTSLSITLEASIIITNVNATPRQVNTTTSTSSSTGITIATWSSENSTSQIDFAIHSQVNAIAPAGVNTFSYYPRTSSPMNITAGETWGYAIYFANGDSISGSLIAQ
jgi:hypothetical protein